MSTPAPNLKKLSVAVSLLALLLVGCSSLPALEGREASSALTETADTRLGKGVQAEISSRPELSGIYALENPRDAFATRALLTRAADRSLDVQYYIWHADTTGFLMFEELWNAAERGVRVRLLLDDNGIGGLDPTIAALDAHRNIEVRLFNPYTNRGFKALGYVGDFDRLNRRMHNKSLTADTQATIVGGRNIGDEYFGAGESVAFADLDVLAVGPVTREVASAFDEYWNSDSAFPAESIIGKAAPDAQATLFAKFAEVRNSEAATKYMEAIRNTRAMQELLGKKLPMEWARARLVCDPVTKTLGAAKDEELLLSRLARAIGTPEKQLDLVSPYFVPGKKGTEFLSDYAKRGIQLRIVTNSLAATDVAAVHAGYAKRREPLLRSGVRIYELKPDAGEEERKEAGGGSGSSSASLHAKTFAIDRSRVFVGSFNFDPRSIRLNTEMGIVIESPKLATDLSTGLDRAIDRAAYEVKLGANGRGLEWVERVGDGEVRYTKEPKTSFMKRFNVGFLELLPIESLL
jgi:putative cardiolipin synthase